MNKKYLLLLTSLLLVSCNKTKYETITHHFQGEVISIDPFKMVFPFNSDNNILYMFEENKFNNVYKDLDSLVSNVSKSLDRYNEFDNNLYILNNSCGLDEYVSVDSYLIECLKLSIEMMNLTDGLYNPFIGGLIDINNDFINNVNSENYELNLSNELLYVPSYSDVSNIIEFKDNTIKFNKFNDHNLIISLGGIGKGYALDKIYEYMNDYNYSYVCNLSNSSSCYCGVNPMSDDNKYNVSLRSPSLIYNNSIYYNSDEVINKLKLDGDIFISCSGDDIQRRIIDDKIYTHIIDPSTGISNNVYRSICLISKDCKNGVLDALSTAVYNTKNINEAKVLIKKIENYYNININYLLTCPYQNSLSQYDVYYNSDFSDYIDGEFDNNIVNKTIL